ncbi:MAG TPA: 4Fe-4S binding protein [Clostridiaceae bacterium]|nr:4Fe-4S binding protein [Clostridiaceae bacterium]
MIFYFTGTGNSLYVAKRFDENPISIPQVINQSNQTFTDKTIGIVCPIYSGDLPRIVKRFMEKATFNTDYFYFILTYGKDHSAATENANKFAKDLGITVNYAHTILMVDNYLPVFNIDEERTLDKKIDEQLAAVMADIKSFKSDILEPTEAGRALYRMAVERDKNFPSMNNGEQITVKDSCIGCGICTQVCPIGNFYVEEGIAKRHEETCEFCLSCANNCPQKAIGMKMMDRNPNARYRHEEITLQEIIAANNQTI